MNTNTYYIYKHTFPNTKIYIGITCRLPKARWGKNGNGYLTLRKNKYPAQPKMFYAIKKYGWNNILHEILDVVKTKEEAIKLEKHYIALYKSTMPNFGYNIENGGKYNGNGFFQDLGRCWWNNGIEEVRSIECPGENWIPGKKFRLPVYKFYTAKYFREKYKRFKRKFMI